MKLLPVKQQLELEDEDDDGTEKELILFRVDGTIIPKGPVAVCGYRKEWT